MRIIIRQVRGRKKHPNWAGIAKEVERTMDAEVKPKVLGYATKIVANWKHKPTFKAKKQVSTTAITLDVWPTGPNAKYWKWTSRGTRKRDITPKKKGGVLAFPSGYTPKTRPRGPSYGGSGASSGKMIFTTFVKDHKIKARKFEEAWARWAKKWFAKTMENAIRRGARSA